LSAVRDCLFNIFAANLRIGGGSSTHNLRTHHAVVTDTHLSWVLYGCETWSFTSKEERRLRVFENRMTRRIFGPKRDEVTRKWRKLHNE